MSSLQNVAVNKGTKVQRVGGGAYGKIGDKANLVDGVKTATFDGSGCSGCFGSNPVSGYWQVNLGQEYFVAYVKIFGVSGE